LTVRKVERQQVDGATLQSDYNTVQETFRDNPPRPGGILVLLSPCWSPGGFVVLVSEPVVFGGLRSGLILQGICSGSSMAGFGGHDVAGDAPRS